MSEMPVSAAREHLADVIDGTRRSGEPVYVTRRGRRVAVIMDAETFDRMVDSAEERADLQALAAARAAEDYVPWDEVKVELGLA